MTATDFPIFDAPRLYSNNRLGRIVIDDLGAVDAYIEESDEYCSMPLRLVHDQGHGVHLEIGPYALGRSDVERLRAAIAAYDRATR